MSEVNRPYNIDEINKKILVKAPVVHSEREYLGPQNLYRDEDYEIYKAKRHEFYEAAKIYKERNKSALLSNKDKLDVHSNDILQYPDHATELQPKVSLIHCKDDIFKDVSCNEDVPNLTGVLLRKRAVRRIHEDDLTKMEVCCLEPWFRRYLKLCKFIYAVRKVILKNRLLKNLEILKSLDSKAVAGYEAKHIKYENVSYPHIFEKFINGN